MDELQEQCSPFDITQLVNHYSFQEGGPSLTCSIPILVSNSKLVVDYIALSKQEEYSLQWTQIYSPTQAKQVIGNSTACGTLLTWLQSWSNKCSKKAVSNTNNRLRKGRTTSSDPDFIPSNYFCTKGDFTRHMQMNDSATGELLPAALLCGPHGSGKTAAVYTCAAESGFKVTSKIRANCM